MAVSSLRSISFPFRRGPTGFPEPAKGPRAVVENVFSLLLMARQELPMGNSVGTGIYSFVHETSGPLLGARVAADVRAVIRAHEPRMTVLGVTTEEKITRDGTQTVAAVEYEIGDENGTLEVPIGEGGGFVS